MHAKGFSFVELMIVVAIVGLLTTIATPIYKKYSIRVKVASVLPILHNEVHNFMEHYNRNGSFPIYSTTVVKTFTSGYINQIFADTAADGSWARVYPSWTGSFIPPIGSNDRLYLFVFRPDASGHFKTLCGSDLRVGLRLLPEYVPDNCIVDLFEGGTTFKAGYP